MILAYAIAVSEGEASLTNSSTSLKLKTVQNCYVLAAASFAVAASYPDPRFQYDFRWNRVGDGFFPALSDFYQMMSKWSSGKSQALPLTLAMLRWMITKSQIHGPNSCTSCYTDAAILGCYTGSRCAEYAAGPSHKGEAFGRVPSSAYTASFGGWPIAFTNQDFSYLSSTLTEVSWTHASTQSTYVRIRFRYDKGGTGNFSTRTFRRLDTSLPSAQLYLCPLLHPPSSAALVSSLERLLSPCVLLLHVAETQPSVHPQLFLHGLSP